MEPTRSYQKVAEFAREEDAVAAVRLLLERGIGADIERSETTENLVVGPTTAYAVLVLHNDAARAAEHLGVALPEPSNPAGPAALATAKVASAAAGGREEDKVYRFFGGRMILTGKQVTTVLIVYALALVVIPVAAFFAVRTILGPDQVQEPEPVLDIDSQQIPLFERDDF